jgi:UDP-3-O-[3-hydroxymyristoyl] N-acetylglucosamine deacetylase/3-hydroxyacyl-[acyl-carrier-protein] dehydratase
MNEDQAVMATGRRAERTIASEARVRGVSFLSGLDVELTFQPAEAGAGIQFVRTDLPGNPSVPAHIRHVIPRQRRTTIRRGEAVVEMVEHVLAALSGLQIDNCTVAINGPETPGCDGSSRAFVEALAEAGSVAQDRPREVLTIDRPITVREGASVVTAHPGEGQKLVLSYNLDYGRDTPIGSQSLFLDLSPETFRGELAECRTFLLASEAMALRQAGIGARTSEVDLLIFGPDGPINNELRFPDECVRHKMLDMVGDLALLGKDISGHVVAHRSGHQLNAELVRALLQAADKASPDLPTTEPTVDASGLDIQGILKLMPHRYPFLLIDRVTELVPGRRIVAIKNVSVNEPFFQGHLPGKPIMPGVLILESLAQAAGVMIAQWAEVNAFNAVIAGIDEARMRRPIVPGDQVRLEVQLLRAKPRLAEVRGIARVDNQVAAEARIRFMLTDSERAA